LTVLLNLVINTLDLVGIFIISLGLTKILSEGASASLRFSMSFFGIETTLSASIVCLIGILFLLFRTLLSMPVSRFLFSQLGEVNSLISSKYIEKFSKQEAGVIRLFSKSQVSYFLTAGIDSLTFRVLGNVLLLVLEIIIVLLMFCFIVSVNLFASAITFLIIFLSMLIIKFFINDDGLDLGKQYHELTIQSIEQVEEFLKIPTELYLRGSGFNFTDKLRRLRFRAADIHAKLSLTPFSTKYTIEAAVMSCLAILFVLSMYFGTYSTTSDFAIVLVGIMRIMPGILRAQQSIENIKSNLVLAQSTLHFMWKLESESNVGVVIEKRISKPVFITVSDVAFEYPRNGNFSISNLNLDIRAGDFVAIVGPSGSGKSTLAKLILGEIKPDIGKIEINGLPPSTFIRSFPGAVSYTPQTVHLLNDSIEGNLSLGSAKVTNFDLNTLLLSVGLGELMNRDLNEFLGDGIDSRNLSVGQLQRLGIARALYSDPQLLILDEPTSALDAETELLVSKTIMSVKERATLLVIAHRLSTVRAADKVVYMESGKIVFQGSYEETRNQVPDFDKQSKLLGF
jgi:ABC-type transport system involved in cytochrome bd biosynthesis fused ATPase/permease subunit